MGEQASMGGMEPFEQRGPEGKILAKVNCIPFKDLEIGVGQSDNNPACISDHGRWSHIDYLMGKLLLVWV